MQESSDLFISYNQAKDDSAETPVCLCVHACVSACVILLIQIDEITK